MAASGQKSMGAGATSDFLPVSGPIVLYMDAAILMGVGRLGGDSVHRVSFGLLCGTLWEIGRGEGMHFGSS